MQGKLEKSSVSQKSIFEWHSFKTSEYDLLKSNRILEEINESDPNYIRLKSPDLLNPRWFSTSGHQHIVDPDTNKKTI